MTITLALAGDTMLGRGTAKVLSRDPSHALVSDEIEAAAREADVFLLNLECCISDRGRRWPDRRKAFFFRAPPVAVEALVRLGVGCVTIANNHALDFGYEAFEDTLTRLRDAGIPCVGGGPDLAHARDPAVLDLDGGRLTVFGATDHPSGYAATDDRPGVAVVDFTEGLPQWLEEGIARHRGDVVVVTPHWGPNMTTEPLPEVLKGGRALIDAGATLVAGHSAHVFHGVDAPVLFDLGDFIDDYAVDPFLRNDLGLLYLVTLDASGPQKIEALPLRLHYARTEVARGDEAAWIERRLTSACAEFGTRVSRAGERLVIEVEG